MSSAMKKKQFVWHDYL